MTAQQKWMEQAKARKGDLAGIVSRFNADRVPAFIDALDVDNLQVAGEILQETWDRAPDQPWIHEIPGWSVFCDLCSDFVFGEAGEPNLTNPIYEKQKYSTHSSSNRRRS